MKKKNKKKANTYGNSLKWKALLLIVGIVAVSIIPTIVGIVRGRMHKVEKTNEEATDKKENEAK